MLAFISSIGSFELLIIAVLVLIVVGPKRLPQLAQTVGKGMREFRSAANDLQREVHRAKEELMDLAQDGVKEDLQEFGEDLNKLGLKGLKKGKGGLGVSSNPPPRPIKHPSPDTGDSGLEGTVKSAKPTPTITAPAPPTDGEGAPTISDEPTTNPGAEGESSPTVSTPPSSVQTDEEKSPLNPGPEDDSVR